MQSANTNWAADTNQKASPHLAFAGSVNSNVLTPQNLSSLSKEIMRLQCFSTFSFGMLCGIEFKQEGGTYTKARHDKKTSQNLKDEVKKIFPCLGNCYFPNREDSGEMKSTP